MVCEKCKKRIVMNAFGTGICGLCKKEIISPNLPVPILCHECSDKEGLCEVCGKSMWTQMTLEDMGED